MKTAVLVLGGLLLAGSGWAQQLQGGFALASPKGKPNRGTGVIWFVNGRFKERSGGCVASDIQYDEGSFSRVGNCLTLHYDQWQQPASTFTATALPGGAGPSLTITVLDARTRETLPGMAVMSRPHNAVRCLTDSLGRVIVHEFEGLTAADTLVVSCHPKGSYMPLCVPAGLAINQHLTILLAPAVNRTSSGKVKKFIIQQLTANSLVLKWPDLPLAVRYVRIPANQARQAVIPE